MTLAQITVAVRDASQTQKPNEQVVVQISGLLGKVFGHPLDDVDGPFAEDFTSLKWRYKEHRDGETAKFTVGGILAEVIDCDGDFSIWCVKRNGKILAEGTEDECNPPHFFAALARAESALRGLVDVAKLSAVCP